MIEMSLAYIGSFIMGYILLGILFGEEGETKKPQPDSGGE